MNIVYCHIDYAAGGQYVKDGYSYDDLPEYALYSIWQSRFASPGAKQFLICNSRNISAGMMGELTGAGVTVVEQDDLVSDKVKRATAAYYASNFDRRLGNFNYTGIIRYFFVEELMKKASLSDVLYMEYDNLLYEDLDAIPAEYFDGDYVVPSVNARSICAGVAFFRTPGALSAVNENIISLMKSRPGVYIRDMELVPIAVRGRSDVRFFSSIPGDREYIFDPCSFGQFIYGNNSSRTPGFVNVSHDCGAYIYRNMGHVKIFKERSEFIMQSRGRRYKFVNLHIHNKQAIKKATTYNDCI